MLALTGGTALQSVTNKQVTKCMRAVFVWIIFHGSFENVQVAASIWYGTSHTSSGGFSHIFPRPSWQADAVQGWLKDTETPFTARQNKTVQSKRGYPDVAFLSRLFPIFTAQGARGSCCQEETLDGTSASAPVFAGMVTLVNDHLLHKGLPPLGKYPGHMVPPRIADTFCVHRLFEPPSVQNESRGAISFH